MCPCSRFWGGVLDCDSQFTIPSPISFDGHQLWRSMSVCSSRRLYLPTRAHCAWWCSPWSLCSWPRTCWRKDTITRLCASHTCVTWSAKSLSFFPSCTSSFLSLVLKSLSTTDLRLPITKLICSNSYSRAAALDASMILSHLLLLLSSLGTFCPCLSIVSILKYIRSVDLHWLRPHPVACPRNDLRRKTLDPGCAVPLDFFWLVLSPL